MVRVAKPAHQRCPAAVQQEKANRCACCTELTNALAARTWPEKSRPLSSAEPICSAVPMLNSPPASASNLSSRAWSSHTKLFSSWPQTAETDFVQAELGLHHCLHQRAQAQPRGLHAHASVQAKQRKALRCSDEENKGTSFRRRAAVAEDSDGLAC